MFTPDLTLDSLDAHKAACTLETAHEPTQIQILRRVSLGKRPVSVARVQAHAQMS